NGRLGLDCTTLSPTAQAFTPRHLAQAFESLAVSTVAVACSLRSSRAHPTLSPTSTPFPFAHRQKIRACSQGGQPQQPTSWAQTFKSPPIGHFSRFLHRAVFFSHCQVHGCGELPIDGLNHWETHSYWNCRHGRGEICGSSTTGNGDDHLGRPGYNVWDGYSDRFCGPRLDVGNQRGAKRHGASWWWGTVWLFTEIRAGNSYAFARGRRCGGEGWRDSRRSLCSHSVVSAEQHSHKNQEKHTPRNSWTKEHMSQIAHTSPFQTADDLSH